MKDIDHKAHTKTQTSVSGSKQDTPWVSCLAPARLTTSTISFITGGHDKSVKLWKVDSDGHASSERIGGIGVSAPSALVSRDGTVLVSAGKHLFTLDMHHKAAALAQAKLSNPINQIHIHPNAPTITILEVCYPVSLSMFITDSSYRLIILTLRSRCSIAGVLGLIDLPIVHLVIGAKGGYRLGITVEVPT